MWTSKLTDVPHFSVLHEIVQRLHRLLWRHRSIVSVDLQQVNVVGPQPLQTSIHCVEDGCAAQAALVDVVLGLLHFLAVFDMVDAWLLADRAVALREDYQLVTREVLLFDELADHFFGDAVGVHVGCVPCVQTDVPGALEELEGFLFIVDHPRLPVFVACWSDLLVNLKRIRHD